MFNFLNNLKKKREIIKLINDIDNDDIIEILKVINLTRNEHLSFFYGKFRNIDDVIYYFPIEDRRFDKNSKDIYRDYYKSDLIFAIYGDDLSQYKDFCSILFVNGIHFYLYCGIYSENKSGRLWGEEICKITEPEKIREAVSSLIVHEHIKEKLLNSLNNYLIKIDLPK